MSNNQIVYELQKTDKHLIEKGKNKTKTKLITIEDTTVFNNSDDAINFAISDIIENCINQLSVCKFYEVWLNEATFSKSGIIFHPYGNTNIIFFYYDINRIFNPFKLKIRKDYKDDEKIKSLIKEINKLEITRLDLSDNFFLL